MQKVIILLFSALVFIDSIQAKVNESQLALENEKNTVDIFQSSVKSVVHISNIRIARQGWFARDAIEIPSGAGSGFIWDKQGHIVTNYHVVDGGDKFNVRFHKDNKEYKAVYVGGVREKDIAVLRLESTPKNLTPVTAGKSSNLLVGQKALAIGNPFGLDHTLTTGVISALGRKIRGYSNIKIYDMIQTDTSINPGNSGGPLLNSRGQLIGMNTMIFSNSGSSAGVGFAVPVDTISRLVPQLIEHGKIIQPGLGVGPLEKYYYDYFDVQEGLVVKSVKPNSPAEKAGIKGIELDRRGRYYLGDIIIAIDGKPIKNFDDIYNILGKYSVGDRVTVSLRNGRKTRDVKVKLIQVND
jgi:S1-C subfamily serine protease